ncbi:MAG TPA: DAHL domain-containing protein [Patescibacteria group bacterium]|nr:DAHL domain-containing protein [Patescibacteria group bacterium]
MRRSPRLAAHVFIAAVVVIAAVMVLATRSDVAAQRHSDLIATFEGLAQAETRLDRDLLEVISGVLPHYDSLVAHTNDLRRHLGQLNEAENWLEPPQQPLADFRSRIEARLSAAEDIKGMAAFVRNEEAYLPFAVAGYAATARPDIAVRIQGTLIDLEGYERVPSVELGTKIEADFARFDTAAAPDLIGIVTHMRTMKHQRDLLRQGMDRYFAIPASDALEQVREQYMAAFARHQTKALLLTRSLMALSLGLFVGLGWAILRLGQAHDQAERAGARLADAVNCLDEAFSLFDDGHRLILNNPQFSSLFGDIDGYGGLTDRLTERAGSVVAAEVGQDLILQDIVGGRWHLFRSRPTSDGGIVCLFTDLTEHKRIQEQMRKLTTAVEQSPIAIVITDAEAHIEYVNPRFQQLTGYDADEVIGQNPRVLKSGQMPPESYEEMWKTLSAGLTWRGELINRKKDGELFCEHAVISPIKNSGGAITHYIALKEDITIQKRSAELLTLTADQLIDANSDIERMLFAASHDLQEPVRMVLSFAQMLERQLQPVLDERSQDSLDFIMDGARQLDLLIKGMIAYGRSSRPTSAFIPVECRTVVDLAIADCRQSADHVGLSFDVGPLPTVLGDPVLMLMLFENIIGNALKFRDHSTPAKVTIQAEHDDGGWRISIADNGIGIEEQYLTTITQPFSRLHSRATYPGAGLGLASSLKIAAAHGGRLWLDSIPGHGTTVSLWLPATGHDTLARLNACEMA